MDQPLLVEADMDTHEFRTSFSSRSKKDRIVLLVLGLIAGPMCLISAAYLFISIGLDALTHSGVLILFGGTLVIVFLEFLLVQTTIKLGPSSVCEESPFKKNCVRITEIDLILLVEEADRRILFYKSPDKSTVSVGNGLRRDQLERAIAWTKVMAEENDIRFVDGVSLREGYGMLVGKVSL